MKTLFDMEVDLFYDHLRLAKFLKIKNHAEIMKNIMFIDIIFYKKIKNMG